MILVLLAPAHCPAADLVEFLSGSKISGTVKEIRKEKKEFDFEATIGSRTSVRTYPFGKVHAVTIKGKRFVLTPKSNVVVTSAGEMGQRSKTEINRLIQTLGSQDPEWLDSTKLETGYIAALLGFGACYVIDKVYQVTNKITRLNVHSASVFLSAMLFTAVMINYSRLFFIILILKFLLYVYRKIYFRIHHKSFYPIISFIRISIGFFLPVILLQLDLNYLLLYIFGSILIGELIDRIEFYLELDISTPKNQIQDDLADMLQSLSD